LARKKKSALEGKIGRMSESMGTAERDKARTVFDKNEDMYARLAEEVVFILEHELSEAALKYHSVTNRVKRFDSLWEKVQRKRLEDPFAMTDIVGVRVVCLFLSDLRKVGALIKRSFDVFGEDDKIDGQDATSFGYMSLHYDAKLKKTYSGARYDQLVGLGFEIQVRTIAMDAWASASHYLDYKTDKDVPSELKRDFYALSGLFYVADQHFEMFFRSRESVKEKVSEEFETKAPDLDQTINLDNLGAYLKKRFPDRRESAPAETSELIQELAAAGYTKLREVNDTLDFCWKAFFENERERPPNSPSKKFSQIGVVRVTFDIFDDNFAKPRLQNWGASLDHYRKLLPKRKN
jgi:putative GTP pyrophosphokinase